jgi:hypothetical protein
MQIPNPTPKPPIDELELVRVLHAFGRRTVLVVQPKAAGHIVGERLELEITNDRADCLRLEGGHVVTVTRSVLKDGHSLLADVGGGAAGLERRAIEIGILPGKRALEIDAAQTEADAPPAEAPKA